MPFFGTIIGTFGCTVLGPVRILLPLRSYLRVFGPVFGTIISIFCAVGRPVFGAKSGAGQKNQRDWQARQNDKGIGVFIESCSS